MIEIVIPGSDTLSLAHLLMDYNGTLAQDGVLLEGLPERLLDLSEKLQLHVITANTFGHARRQLEGIPCEVAIVSGENQAQAKLAYLEQLGRSLVVAVGNGRNDHLMLQSAALGIAVIQGEGAALPACLAADVIVPDVLAALDLLRYPKRLIATLRN
ncbi:MAG: HAD family hydrolase [Chloroflexota bacterium]